MRREFKMTQQMQDISIDEFRARVRSFRPKCQLCGHEAHSLVSHLRETHGLSAGQYKKKFPDAELASPIAIELLRNLGKEPSREGVPLASLLPKFLPTAGVTNQLFQDWKARLSWYTVPPGSEKYIPKENKNFHFTSNAQLILFGFATGRNVFISGPTGCGKTEEYKQVFNRLGFPLRRANMHGDVTYTTFVGTMKANAQGTYFDYGLLPNAMREGYPVLLDEIDFTPPNIASILFPVLEKDSELFIPETGEHIKPKKGFTILATGNTGGKGDNDGSFTGTEVLNTAFLDRFSLKLNATYLPEAVEEAVISDTHPHLDPNLVKVAVKFAKEIRTAFLGGDLAFTWSTRKILDFVEFLPVMGLEEALKVTLTNWLDKDDLPFVENLVKKVGLSNCRVLR